MLEEMTLCEEVFHTPSGVAFADVIRDGHREAGPFAANVSEPGCGAVTTRRPELLQAMR
jgi:hypothetical protein